MAPRTPRAGGRAAREEDRREVRVDHGAPVVVAHPCEDPVARQAGVVDEHVDVAGRLDERLRGLGVGDVRLDCSPTDLRGDRSRLVGPRPVADDDLGARAAQLERDRTPDPAGAAGLGDGENDVVWMRRIGVPVAMGNARPEARAVALAVTGHHAQEGAADFLEEVLRQLRQRAA